MDKNINKISENGKNEDVRLNNCVVSEAAVFHCIKCILNYLTKTKNNLSLPRPSIGNQPLPK